jgi:glycerate 2-kinase
VFAEAAGVDLEQHLNQQNAYPYFKVLGDLIMTGATGTNVMDVDIALVSPQQQLTSGVLNSGQR